MPKHLWRHISGGAACRLHNYLCLVAVYDCDGFREPYILGPLDIFEEFTSPAASSAKIFERPAGSKHQP